MEILNIIKLKLSTRELKIMILLQLRGAMRNKDIVEGLKLAECNISITLKKLEKKGYILKRDKFYSLNENILNQNILNQNISVETQINTNSKSTEMKGQYLYSTYLNIFKEGKNKDTLKRRSLKTMTPEEQKQAFRLIKEFRLVRGLKAWNATDQEREMAHAKRFIVLRKETVEELIGLMYQIKEKLPFEWGIFWSLGTLWTKESQWKAKLEELENKKTLNFHQWLDKNKNIPDLDYRLLPATQQWEKAKRFVMAFKKAGSEIVPTANELERYHLAVEILTEKK
jgi:DNA-binding Lrp family transcriptional regulator